MKTFWEGYKGYYCAFSEVLRSTAAENCRKRRAGDGISKQKVKLLYY
ncbi:hypothetical protein [Geobacillus thermodenitrificans]|nr:hypothetical protein [Geobacillus thermodenitrificans]